VFEVLEQHGLKVWLVDARQLKYVPGRKSDVQDCQWLQKLMSLGLLRAAWRPSAEVCVLRAVARQRETCSPSRPAGCSACRRPWCR
jgi:transposase